MYAWRCAIWVLIGDRLRHRTVNIEGELATTVALYPFLDDPYYSGDTVLILDTAAQGSHIAYRFRYRSPVNRGTYDEHGPSVRWGVRCRLRATRWLDIDGKPIIIPRTATTMRLRAEEWNEECKDRTSRVSATVSVSTNASSGLK
jgi:hypothetical protein